ncbi:protein kinase domain-containing protein [Verrucomicrobiota bacterium sgz303538]
MSEVPPSPERQSRVEVIFYGALERGVLSERLRFVEEACEGDTTLQSAVEELLQAHSDADSKFLEDGPLSAEGGFEFLRTERSGDLVGHYRLLEPIGEGGFGTVWRAEQQKPVRRRVALKVLKLGMDTREVIARFEAERQALALMDHPSIAKVLDAGSTPAGRPFFVMELVEGVRITDFCDSQKLSSQERLKLFVHVCQAVQHAHQKGIIHRDIKPSNVLVSVQDGVPVPKVIDFGVAKATQQKLTELTLQTRMEQIIGTPLYMSPEQAQFGGLDIDTRSDIYSLGVLLYELLTGRTPFDPGSLMQRGLDEIRRVIREEEPPRPSTALRTMAEETVNSVARQRQSEPPKLISLLRGDLDWIVMRALEKERSRRYETASSFAEDIRRHLANETVLARPPSASYRFRRLVQRNKGSFAAAAAITAALLIGITVSLWQAVRADREATRANATLTELRASALAFAEQARALIEEGRFEDAIEKLDYAIKLRPDVAQYSVSKGDLLQSLMRLGEATNAYHAALLLDPNNRRVLANARLCERLHAKAANTQKLSRESLSQLYTSMQNEQRPPALLMPVARQLGEEKRHLIAFWIERLKHLSIPPERPIEKRLTMRSDGLLALDLSYTTIADLKPLKGMELGALNCTGCGQLTDLAPLQSMPLQELSLAGTGIYDITALSSLPELRTLRLEDTKVTNLSPLRGLPLHTLYLSRLEIHDLSPLRAMPLENLSISHLPATNLSALEGMPLKHLEADSIAASDFSPLANLPLRSLSLRSTRPLSLEFVRRMPLKELFLSDCRAQNLSILSEVGTLEIVTVGPDYHSWPEAQRGALVTLRNHPHLRQIGAEFEPGRTDTVQTTEQFWKEWDKESEVFQPLRAAGVNVRMRVLPDYTWEVDLSNEPVKDLSSLKGAPISRLSIARTKVSDLGPLTGMRLTALSIRHSNVADLRPLVGMPLEEIDIGETYVRDISPLKGMALKRLGLEQTEVSDLSPLKGMPLQELWTGTTAVKDLSPLIGMPLRLIQIDDCRLLTDVSALASIPSLEQILLPRTAGNVDTLRGLPRLRYISFQLDPHVNRPSQTPDEFWSIKNPNTQEELVKQGRFAELEQSLRIRIENRDSVEEWKDHIKRAAAQVALGNSDGYRAVCAQMMERFRELKPESVLEAASLADDSGISLADLQKLFDAWMAHSDGKQPSPWAMFIRGLSLYRLNRYDKAAKIFKEVGPYDGAPTAASAVVLAMARYKASDRDAARIALALARTKVAEELELSLKRPDSWHEVLAATLLLKEAENMIEGSRPVQDAK